MSTILVPTSLESDYQFNFNTEHLKLVRNYPHILGHMAGKDRLTDLHSMWIRYVWDTTDQNRSLQAHRGSYKTTACVVIGAIWWMLFHPNDRIAIIRKTFTDAADALVAIAAAMEQPAIQALFYYAHGIYPRFKQRKYGRLTFNFKSTSTPEGSVTAHGLDLGLTGKHYDKIITDDIITLKDRISKAERDKTLEIIREITTNIIDPGKAVGNIGTPWHRNDGWTILPEPWKWDVNRCKILRPHEIEEKKKATTPVLYSVNYELTHRNSDDLLFADPNYRQRWDFSNRGGKTFAHVDAAFDGDHTCALTIMRAVNNRIQAVGKSYPGNIKDWIPQIAKWCRSYRVHSIYCEKNADKGWTIDLLRKYGLHTEEYDESMNKHIKISSCLYEKWDDIDWVENETEDTYMEQVIDYREKEEPDDAPDSAASLVRAKFHLKAYHSTLWSM